MTNPLTRPTAQALIERLEKAYAFECEGGPLKNCREFIELKEAITLAASCFRKTLREFEIAGKPAGYVCTTFCEVGLTALASAEREMKETK